MDKPQRKFLKKLLETPSPTGCETPVASLVRERVKDVCDSVETNYMG